MVLALMTASRRVYATADVVLSGSPDPDLAARLTRTFSLTPRGLVFALGNGGTPKAARLPTSWFPTSPFPICNLAACSTARSNLPMKTWRVSRSNRSIWA